MSDRVSGLLAMGMPYFVGEVEDKVIGYCYAGPRRRRACYQYTIETSIYLHPDYLGAGHGSALLRHLIEACEAGPWHQMAAGSSSGMDSASVNLHKKFGFSEVGIFKSVGYRFGTWVGVVWVQKSLQTGSCPNPNP